MSIELRSITEIAREIRERNGHIKNKHSIEEVEVVLNTLSEMFLENYSDLFTAEEAMRSFSSLVKPVRLDHVFLARGAKKALTFEEVSQFMPRFK